MDNWILLLPVTGVLFFLYWIVGGVVFAMVALFRVKKLRKARFSCLFTLASIGCAIGATFHAHQLAKANIDACLHEAPDVFAKFASVIACGLFEILAMSAIWFVGFMFIGALLLYLSRSKNQSWVDEVKPETHTKQAHAEY